MDGSSFHPPIDEQISELLKILAFHGLNFYYFPPNKSSINWTNIIHNMAEYLNDVSTIYKRKNASGAAGESGYHAHWSAPNRQIHIGKDACRE
ncbi:MAG: hypothetical protein GWP06_07650 [Actinobacteria bacterium]|nr:hypothetical protein [Actinomycetota bacterium]